MSDFGQRIKQARIEANLSQEALAIAISELVDKKRVSRTTITQWESSKAKGIEAANLLKVAAVLNVNPEWLQFGRGDKRSSEANDITLNACFIPLIESAADFHAIQSAAQTRIMVKKDFLMIPLDEILGSMADSNSFALMITNNSMSPLFQPDDVVIMDPSIYPSPGEFVTAVIDDHDKLLFRKYRPLSQPTEFELIALNEDWCTVTVSEKVRGNIVGTLIEHRCRRRI